MVVPQIGWFIRDNPIKIWMMTRGTPILGNPQMSWKMMRLFEDH